tara:strand:- start:485 stop:2125 length:1641 start_codon:yes stop_codon:yes gene_type:complete
MKSLSKFIIETQSGGIKSGSGTEDPWFPNKNGKKNRKSNSGKSKGSTNKIGSGVEDSGDRQVRSAASDPKSSKIQREIEGQTKRKTREFTQKSGVTKGNDPASMNRRLSAELTKQQQLDRGYGTAGFSGDSNMGAGAGGASGNTKPSPTKPVSSAEKQMLKKTSRQTGGKVSVSYAEPVRTRTVKSGQDKLLDKIFSPKAKKGGSRIPGTGSRIPDPKKGELGKLYKTSTKSDPKRGGSVRTTDKINQELTAKRAARINPKTGKATKKGVENFAINQQTKGLSAKGDAGKQAMANAKKIAGNARSKAYKDIANKINTSDYAGKRAKLASTKELDKIAKSIKTSKTINTAVDIGKASKAPTAFSRSLSPSKTSLNTATRKGKVTPLTKTSGIKYKASDSSKKTFSQFKSASGQKSNFAKLKIKPGRLLGKGFAAWNAIDNYNAAKGSPLRKLAKSAVTTAAYYKGGTAGAALGTGFGAITGPGALVTGGAGFVAGSETASNLASRTFNKVWKPPTTKKNKKVVGAGAGTGNKGFTWKSGIAFESGKK